jgi:ADP-ribosylation factor-binding protein GGA
MDFLAKKQNNEIKSQLKTLIDLACDSSLPEPDMALNLEVCDYINKTKKNSGREAAMEIVGYVNGRSSHQTMLALTLLDFCVKNCGYPFHLQISSKDFLNELVKKFPEKPPTSSTATIDKTLELISVWNHAIFDSSKYKQDLTHINDMYRLLSSKGYKFPTLKMETFVVASGTSCLKTKDELIEEEKEAMSAKLQELLRANILMKALSGANRESDEKRYEKKADEEINRIRENSTELIRLMDNFKQGDRIDGKMNELYGILKVSNPKLAKWINDCNEVENFEQMGLFFFF